MTSDAAQQKRAAPPTWINTSTDDDTEDADDVLDIDAPRPLTPRQCEALDLHCQGFSRDQIAHHLGTAPQTIKAQLHDAADRLGVGASRARRRGQERPTGTGVLLALAWIRIREHYLAYMTRLKRPLPGLPDLPDAPLPDTASSALLSDEEKLWRRIDKKPPSAGGHWLWRKGPTATQVTPETAINHHQRSIRRYLYECVHGPLPPNRYVYRTCIVAACINPAHAAAGPHSRLDHVPHVARR